ncbi:MAG: hypothetical protein ACYC6M_10080, partial [Terriglobales bacterium]
ALGTAAWLGLLCGFIQAAFLQFDWFFARRGVDYASPRMWLVGPLAWAIWVMAWGVLLRVLSSALRRSLELPILLSVSLGALGWMLLAHPILIRWLGAEQESSLGPAIWGCLWFAGCWYAQRRWAGRLLQPGGKLAAAGLPTTLLVAALLAITNSSPALAHANTFSQNAGPNVILIFLDTFRADAVVHSVAPALTVLGRRGMVFDNAFAPAPWTVPSHVAVVSGTSASRLNVDWDDQHYDGQRAT